MRLLMTLGMVLTMACSLFAQDLLAMTYAGPTNAEIVGTLERHEDELVEIRDSIAVLRELIDASKCQCNQSQAPKPLEHIADLVTTKQRVVTLHGKPINVSEYITKHRGYSAPHFTIHNEHNIGNVHEHLADHGFAGFEHLDKPTLMALHQARHHEAPVAMATSIPRQTTTRSRSNCANGNCSRPRGLLFGFGRRR